MAAEVAEQGKIGEPVAGSPPKNDDATAKKGHRRTSSSVTGVFNINELGQ